MSRKVLAQHFKLSRGKVLKYAALPSSSMPLVPLVVGATEAFRSMPVLLSRRMGSSTKPRALRTAPPVSGVAEKARSDGRFTAMRAIPASSMV